MRESVSPIQVCISGSLISLFGPSSADLLLPAFSTLCRGKINLSEFTHLIVRFCWYSCAGEFHLSCFTHFSFIYQGLPLQSPSFLPSVPHAGESFTHQASRIRSFAFVSISCRGELPIKRFTHLILRLYYLDSRLPCLQYPMQGRVSPIELYASDSSPLLFCRPCPVCPQYLMWERILLINACIFDSSEVLSSPFKDLYAILCGENVDFLTPNYPSYCVTSIQVFIIHPGGENYRLLLHRRILPLHHISRHSRLLIYRSLPLIIEQPISYHSRLLYLPVSASHYTTTDL